MKWIVSFLLLFCKKIEVPRDINYTQEKIEVRRFKNTLVVTKIYRIHP